MTDEAKKSESPFAGVSEAEHFELYKTAFQEVIRHDHNIHGELIAGGSLHFANEAAKLLSDFRSGS